ncbi:uncharacterized protein LOC100207311 isoform X7 [Hydra vulgaris]|uniref:Uncharacterized protein LOC100207311 isoform X7 n=1 Tax=Hydra vulgaris TaxID=6087 RepID=A0ABM4D421_HYDVU
MNMIKKNEYYQLCYSNEKVDKGCEKLLEGQMSLNSTSILEYIFEWEYIVRRRAFSDRQLQNSYKITSICKICKDINIGLKKDIPSKTFSASCCDITKESLLSYKNCQSLEVCSNCKFSQLIMLKSNNIQFTCLNNSFCLRKKYHSTHFSRSLINSYNFSNTNIFLGCSSSHHYEILGKDRFCDMLNNQSTTFNSQSSQSVNCERFNQSYLKSIKKNEEKYKANYETQYSVLPSLSPSSLHKSKSSPQLQREKSVHCSNKVIGLEQPSSFVKTVYQYIDEDVFMLKYASTDSIQVYSSGLMRHFQELKPKLKCRYTKVPLKRTIECGANENITFFSGRRISETSASIISTLAFISQESIKSSLNYKKDILTSTHLYKLRIKNGDRHCIFNRLSDWFEILERNLKPAKNGLKPFISDQDLNLNDRNQAFCNKKVKFKKLKHAAFFLSRKSQEKIFFYNKSVKRNIYSNSSLSFQKSNNFKLQKCCVDKSSLPKDNSKISTLFLKHRLSLPQPISKYGELFKNKQTKINKCDEKMSTGSIDYLDKMKSDYNENLDVFNNNINSLSQSLKCDVDSFTAKDLLSLSKQKKNSDEKNFQLDKKKIEKHDLIDLGLLHCNSMNEKLKTDSVKELSKDDLEIKRSRKGSFIGKIKRKYMGSRSCDIEYFKSGLDKNAGHSEESGSKFGIRYHSEVIIEEESKTSPKVSGNRKWKKDSKEKTNKTTELPKESKFSTILSVFEQDNLSTDSKITKNVKSTTNIKLKSSEKKSVIESKKKVLSNSPKKSSVPSFLTTFSPLRARKNSNNIPVQKSAELDNKISAKEKELKELKIQQNQNRTEIDEVKPRSVSANGYYKPHKHVMFAEDSENVNFASQSSSTFLTTEHHLKKCVSSPSILSKSNFLFEPQQTFNCIDNKQIYSSPLKDSIELLDNNLIKQESQDFLCKSSTNNKNLSHKCIATNANISRVMCQESKLSNESFQNFLKVQDICFSVNSRNIFGEVAKKYEGSPITKERIKHLEQSLTPLLKQHSVVEENKFQSLSSSKIAMIIPFMKDTSKTGDEGFSSKNQYLLKRSNTIASGEISLKRKPSVIWAKVKNMEVTLVVDCDYQRFMQLKIESFEVRRVNTHKDIEELAVDTFIKHLQLLDKDALDLSSQDIKHLQLHSHEVPIGSIFDIASLNIIDHFLPCFLHLKDKHCWSLAAISYDTLIPKSFLEKYVSLIFVHNYVVFYGPSGTGKSYLARRLSHLVAHRIHENSLPIIYSNISLEKWQKIVQEISCDTSDHSKVYVLDGFTQSFLSSNFDISEILTLPQIMKSKSYVICTCTQGLTDSIPSCWQQNFRWIWLPNHEEPVDCLLQRYLRRKYIQYGNFHLQREFFRIVDWLASAWRHINSLIEKFSSSEYTIGPTMFFPCPSDILNAEEWFVDLWNYSICPYFIQTVRNGIKKYGERTNEWIDPLEMILKTYPWSCEKSKLKFIKIRMEDVGYKKNFQLSETSMTETERLMKFLRQLELLMSESNDLFPFQEL